MKIPEKEKQKFIKDDLYHELRCLLGAATIWQIFKDHNEGFNVVVAMDSAFVHARCLFNFFTRKRRNDISITEFGQNSPYKSIIFDTWEESLHRHVLHIKKARLKPTNLKTGIHLNEQVENLAREILRLWEQFEKDSSASNFAGLLHESRARAIKDAENDTKRLINPPYTL